MPITSFDAELAQLHREQAKNRTEGERFQESLVFLETFNEADALREIIKLTQALKEKNLALALPLTAFANAVKPGLLSALFGLGRAQQVLAASQQLRHKEKLTLEIANLEAQITAQRANVARFRSLDRHQLLAMIKTCACREAAFQRHIQAVEARRERLQQAIGPILDEAARCYQQIGDCEADLDACQAYDEQLALYQHDPIQRRTVYENCALRFNGNGRPQDVAYGLRKQLQTLQRQREKLDARIHREIDRLDKMAQTGTEA